MIRPSGSVRDTWLEACSQASSRPCRSHVSPLDLLHGLRNVVLATRDAHGLYAKYGFAPLAEPERWMAIRRPYR